MIKFKTTLAGYYKIEAVRPDGTVRLLSDWFPNLILDAGLNRIGTVSTWLNYCQLGSGNSVPVETQTALDSLVATNNSSTELSGSNGIPPYYTWLTKVFKFDAGVAAGDLSEVGVGWSTSGSLFSRSLILDIAGNPTTTTVLSDETLYVTYHIKRFLPGVDNSGTFIVDGTTHTYESRSAMINSITYWPLYHDVTTHAGNTSGGAVYNGSIGLITLIPTGSSSNATTHSHTAYSSGSYTGEIVLNWNLTAGNFSGGVSACMVNFCGGCYQFNISPSIMKTSDYLLSLTFQCTWGRN